MTCSVPAERKFTWPVRVYWEDTDAGGIVFYANYLKFFERARSEWLRSLGIAQRALCDISGGIFVVSETRVRYHQPARLDDELLVTAWPLDVGRASMTIQQEAHLKKPAGNVLLCEGTIRIGWIDATSYKPARMPPTLLELLK
jgi:acyl-CoA thioester hydrolase